MKYVGLEVYGVAVKIKNESKRDIKPRLLLLKRFFDFCDINDVLTKEERVPCFGYSRVDSNSIIFANGTLDMVKNIFIPEKASIKNPNAIIFECED